MQVVSQTIRMLGNPQPIGSQIDNHSVRVTGGRQTSLTVSLPRRQLVNQAGGGMHETLLTRKQAISQAEGTGNLPERESIVSGRQPCHLSVYVIRLDSHDKKTSEYVS